MDEQNFENSLRDILESVGEMDEEERYGVNLDEGTEMAGMITYSFDDAGLLTNDSGLVIELENGEKFQLTIVKVQ